MAAIILVAIIVFVYLNEKYKVTPQSLPYINEYKGTNREEFAKKVISISRALKINPNALMVTMYNESRLNPKAINPSSKATGLIQWLPSTAKGLGTSTDALYQMQGTQQLDYVYKYLSTYSDRINESADVYLAVFFPAALWQNDSWNFPSWAVKANPIFDINKDGFLTKGEFKDYFYNKYKSKL